MARPAFVVSEKKVRQRAQSLFHPKTPEARQKKIEYLRASLQILRGNAMNGRRFWPTARIANRRTATEGILYKARKQYGPDLEDSEVGLKKRW